jgi:hypothetical protein
MGGLAPGLEGSASSIARSRFLPYLWAPAPTRLDHASSRIRSKAMPDRQTQGVEWLGDSPVKIGGAHQRSARDDPLERRRIPAHVEHDTCVLASVTDIRSTAASLVLGTLADAGMTGMLRVRSASGNAFSPGMAGLRALATRAPPSAATVREPTSDRAARSCHGRMAEYVPGRAVCGDATSGARVKVFLSWSKTRSRGMAAALHDWLPDVIQSAEPFMSADDVEKGTRWFSEVAGELEACNFGIVCLTAENQLEPWLLFEAGAISKQLGSARVAPLLLDIASADVVGPLGSFQHTLCSESDIWRLVRAVNHATAQPLEGERLRRSFDRVWPDLNAQLDALATAAAAAPAEAPARTEREMIAEMLGLLRSQQRTSAARTSAARSARLRHAFDDVSQRMDGVEFSRALQASMREVFGDDAEQFRYSPSPGRLVTRIPTDVLAALTPAGRSRLEEFEHETGAMLEMEPVDREDGPLVTGDESDA